MKQSFDPAYGKTTSISASTTSARVALGNTQCTSLVVTNLGDADVFIELGGATVVATDADFPVLANSAQVINTDPSVHTYAAAITAASTTTVKFTPGYGV